jgi:hypothetical protein
MIAEITQKPPTDEEFLEVSDDPEKYLEFLISRLAHITLFDTVTISYTATQDQLYISSARDRINDLFIVLLERITVAGATDITMQGKFTEDGVTLYIQSRGAGFAWPPKIENLPDLTEELRLCQIQITLSEVKDLSEFSLAMTPWSEPDICAEKNAPGNTDPILHH